MDPLEELIRAQPGLSIALAVLGLVVGSFLNVVIHRLPKMMMVQLLFLMTQILSPVIEFQRELLLLNMIVSLSM